MIHPLADVSYVTPFRDRIMGKLSSVLILGIALTLAGCASAPAGSGQRSNSAVITRDQLEALNSSNAYDIIQQLHPQWLTPRGQMSLSNPQSNQVAVYMAGSRLGGPSELRGFIGAQLETIQYLDARQATARFGSGNVGGAIVLTQRR